MDVGRLSYFDTRNVYFCGIVKYLDNGGRGITPLCFLSTEYLVPSTEHSHIAKFAAQRKTEAFMRNLLMITLLAAGVVTFMSCASTSKASDEKSETAKQFEVPSDKGVVYMYRRGRAFGAAVQYQVKIDGIEAGGSGPGTFFRWELKPDTYTFSSASNESSAVIELDVEAGEMYFIEQNGKVGLNDVRMKLDVRSDKEGMREVKGCKLLVSSYNPK